MRKAVLVQVAEAYGVAVRALVGRSHREGYLMAGYLLRRAANEPLQTVAIRYGGSPSRISKIQRLVEAAPLTRAPHGVQMVSGQELTPVAI